MSDAAVAVVISVRNASPTIAATIAQVAMQAHAFGQPCELVIVDDASTDDTAAAAAEARGASGLPGVLLTRTTRRGPNASRNAGALAASAPVIVFLDGDDEPLAGWLQGLVDAVTGDDVIAGGSYVIPGRDGRRKVVAANTRSAFGYPYAVGGACAMTRAMFTRVGGFDERITRGGTELEFCIEAQLRHAARIVSVDEARVLHRVPTSRIGRARVHFARERGHQYLRRRLDVEDSPIGVSRSPRPPWPARAEAAGGWDLLAAEIGGRTLGRIAFRWTWTSAVEQSPGKRQLGRDQPADPPPPSAAPPSPLT